MCDNEKKMLENDYISICEEIKDSKDLSRAERERFIDAFGHLYRSISFANSQTIMILKTQFRDMQISYDLYCQNRAQEKDISEMRSKITEIHTLIKAKSQSNSNRSNTACKALGAFVGAIFGRKIGG